MDETQRFYSNIAAIQKSIEDRDHEIKCLRDALEECREQLQEQYDADCVEGHFIGNWEMKLGVMITDVLEKDYRR
jgi:hypothetical protein